MDEKQWLKNFDERQQAEIDFSRLYAQQFHHGTDGHNAKMIIAHFAKMMDQIEGITRGLMAEAKRKNTAPPVYAEVLAAQLLKILQGEQNGTPSNP